MHSIKDIYLVRHGETDYNRLGVVQGSGIDADLNELGRKQAQAFFEAYQHLELDRIYTSKLRRTHQSVDSFIQRGTEWEQHEGLNEISWGSKEGKEANDEDNLYYKNLVTTWREGNVHVTSDEGESPIDVLNRQKPVVDLIISRSDEKSILIAMHGRAMRVLLTHLFNEPLHKMDHFAHYNLCLYHLRYDYQKAAFELVDACNIEHLKHLPESM